MKKWFLFDETKGDIFIEEIKADNIDEAIEHGLGIWTNYMTAAERRQRKNFYIAKCEITEDGTPDLETATATDFFDFLANDPKEASEDFEI